MNPEQDAFKDAFDFYLSQLRVSSGDSVMLGISMIAEHCSSPRRSA